MPQTTYTAEEIGRIGTEISRHHLRSQVMPYSKGQCLMLDIASGDYEIDADDTSAEERLRARRPAGVFFGLRIGYTSASTLSGRMIEEES